MSAKIIINKMGSPFRGSLFTVYFNGKEVATMINKKVFVVEDSGIYAIQLKTSWLKTQTLIVKVVDGETINLSVRNGLKYSSALYITFMISLFVTLLLILFHIQKPEWIVPVQLTLALIYTAYVLYYFIFKRGEVWVLEDANK